MYMKNYKRISKENQEKICDMYLKNIPCSKIAVEFNCNHYLKGPLIWEELMELQNSMKIK